MVHQALAARAVVHCSGLVCHHVAIAAKASTVINIIPDRRPGTRE
jgi:hypothetical protein